MHVTAGRRRSGIPRMERNWGILLALPAIIGFAIFTIGPMVASFWFSLTDWTIGGQWQFIGFDNYREMATEDNLFTKSMVVTIYFSLGSVPLVLLIAFVAASLLNQGVRGRSILRTIYYLPVLMPSVANAILWLWMFNPDFGLFNAVLERAGLPASQWI